MLPNQELGASEVLGVCFCCIYRTSQGTDDAFFLDFLWKQCWFLGIIFYGGYFGNAAGEASTLPSPSALLYPSGNHLRQGWGVALPGVLADVVRPGAGRAGCRDDPPELAACALLWSTHWSRLKHWSSDGFHCVAHWQKIPSTCHSKMHKLFAYITILMCLQKHYSP